MSKTGFILVIVFSSILWIAGTIGAYFLLKNILENNKDRFNGFVGAFLGAVLVGYIYGVVKLIIASQVSVNMKNNSRRREKCLQNIFVDAFTYEIANYFENTGPVTVNSLRNIDIAARM